MREMRKAKERHHNGRQIFQFDRMNIYNGWKLYEEYFNWDFGHIIRETGLMRQIGTYPIFL
jgi:hypothetical protein